MAGRRGKKKGGREDAHVDERWLLTYSDLITLLMALFMVLWSISSVNISKFESLQRSLAEAFSGRVLPGGQGIKENGGTGKAQSMAVEMPRVSLQQVVGSPKSPEAKRSAARREDAQLKQLKKRVDQVARQRGLNGRIKTVVAKDGLHIRITTDDLLFDSGSAVVKADAAPILGDIAKLLAREGQHPVVVFGHTDDVPISGRYRSNWNLSSDRAANVVVELARDGVASGRLTSAGAGEYHPVASNTSPGGRALNRRVEILLPRQFEGGSQSSSITDSAFPKP